MDERVSVAEYLEVDPAERAVDGGARTLDGGREQVGVRQELHTRSTRHRRQRRDGRVLAQEDAVAREELHVAHHREPARQFSEHRRVLAPMRCADAIISPVHVSNLPTGRTDRRARRW